MARKKKKKRVKNEVVHINPYPDIDGDFAYIAGYTPGGAPYGVRWEDVGIDSDEGAITAADLDGFSDDLRDSLLTYIELRKNRVDQ